MAPISPTRISDKMKTKEKKKKKNKRRRRSVTVPSISSDGAFFVNVQISPVGLYFFRSTETASEQIYVPNAKNGSSCISLVFAHG